MLQLVHITVVWQFIDIINKQVNDIYPVIGMSPGNSYFKDEVVKKLLGKVVSKYGRTAILIADIPAISTYIALGYPENRARRDKALPQGNNLRNRVQRAMNDLGYSQEQVRITDWESEVQNNSSYKGKYDEVLELYKTNLDFQKAANSATGEVLEYADKEIPDLNAAIKTAVHYLLSEIAFLEFATDFLNTKKVTYIYHRDWPVYENYIAGKYDGKTRQNLGFEIITTY
jgi:cyclo(L-tyrosyl-L-tyrosyl) synthase